MPFYWLIFPSNDTINSIKPRHLALQAKCINRSALKPDCLCSDHHSLSVWPWVHQSLYPVPSPIQWRGCLRSVLCNVKWINAVTLNLNYTLHSLENSKIKTNRPESRRGSSAFRSMYCSWRGSRVQFSAPTFCGSQLAITLVPEDIMSSWLWRHCHISGAHTYTQAYTYKILNKEKVHRKKVGRYDFRININNTNVKNNACPLRMWFFFFLDMMKLFKSLAYYPSDPADGLLPVINWASLKSPLQNATFSLLHVCVGRQCSSPSHT